ncbi:E3 ubiquitin-protein ligase rnf14 [Bulinus truncatus]|nr:E3 ubiquitin-protein ligase rnf14 [Bulinus truncatus]
MDDNDIINFPASSTDAMYVTNFQEQSDEIVALESIFNSDDEEKIKILTRADKDSKEVFSLLITVSPLPIQDQIQVDIAFPIEDNISDVGAAAAPDNENLSKLQLNMPLMRSLSGQKWLASLCVKYLSPIYLFIKFPPSYPSDDPPQFYLQGAWLSSAQIESVDRMLNQLWTEGSRMPVVYTWVNWLENNLLSHLDIHDHIVLHPATDHNCEDAVSSDVPWIEDIGEIIATMKRYNQEKLDIEFCQGVHECHVCYQEKPGHQFFRMHDCPHNFCHECMMEFCELHVRDGTVEALRCPDRGCSSIIPPYIVQAVLGPEAYRRWEQLLLQKTLDAMSDTVYCPRCTSLVIAEAEQDLHLAYCAVCYFAFCTECNRGWHQGRNCQTDEEILGNLDQRKNVSGLNPAEQAKFEEIRRKFIEEIEAKKAIKAKTKVCPCCRIAVEKIGGCNKMTCKCGEFFCWCCGTKIEGYSHFQNGKCVLFPGVETVAVQPNLRQPPDAVLRIQAQLEVNPELRNNRCYCPMCKQMNLKRQDNNNHIKCWNCKSNFCFTCKSRITGSVATHFLGPCIQHS